MPRRSSSGVKPKNTRGRRKRHIPRRSNVNPKRINRSSSKSSSIRPRKESGRNDRSSSALSSRTRKSIDTLPSHARKIYTKAHKNALKQYTSSSKRQGGKQQSKEQVAHKVAWSAVKKEYKKKGDKWEPKKISR